MILAMAKAERATTAAAAAQAARYAVFASLPFA